jgi:FtsH-binding integral membrane protein
MLGEMPEHPIHVKVVDTQSENVAAEFAALTTYQIVQAGTGLPTQIFPHRYHRYKGYIVITAVAANGVLYLANKPDTISGPTPPPTVFQIPVTTTMALPFVLPVYEAQQPIYAAASVAGVAVGIIDETYGTVQ